MIRLIDPEVAVAGEFMANTKRTEPQPDLSPDLDRLLFCLRAVHHQNAVLAG